MLVHFTPIGPRGRGSRKLGWLPGPPKPVVVDDAELLDDSVRL